MPRNAFLVTHVSTIAELVHQVTVNRVVSGRYERHFGMTRAQVLRFVSTLHKARLTKDQVFEIYSIPKDGRVKMHAERLHKGEYVFADRSGKPILQIRCGNPLTRGPEAVTETPTFNMPRAEMAPFDFGPIAVESPDIEAPVLDLSQPGLSDFYQPPLETEMPYPNPSFDVPTSEFSVPPILPVLPIIGGIVVSQGPGPGGSPHGGPTPGPGAFLPFGAGLLVGGCQGLKRRKARLGLAPRSN